MNEQMKTDFLRRRMVQLREKNNYTLSQMAKEIPVNKSTLSRVEKIGGETSFKKVHEFAELYCGVLNMSTKQKELFLRGEKAVLVDSSALFMRPYLISELCGEYSCVFVPGFVIDELNDIKNSNPNEYGHRALDLLYQIKKQIQIGRVITKNYSIPNSSDLLIIDIATAVSEDYCCDVDIITNDVPLALKIKGYLGDDKPYHLLFLEEYAATRQDLVNMKSLIAIDEYYSDSYDNIEKALGISIPPKDDNAWNCYLSDGTTLIISTVEKTGVPFEWRKKKIQWLIQNGANVDLRDCESKNFPPITHAIKKHDYEMFSFLLNECSADPNIGSRNPYDVGKIRQKNNGNMPLMVAAWENQVDMVRDLCAHKDIKLNQQDGNGFTALIKACYWGNRECRQIIEAAGADTTIIDHEGKDANERWDECLKLGRYKERNS